MAAQQQRADGLSNTMSCLASFMMVGLPHSAAALASRRQPCFRPKSAACSVASSQKECAFASADPLRLFAEFGGAEIEAEVSERKKGVFCSAFGILADPTPIRVYLAPNEIKTDVPCLLFQPSTSQVVIVNQSPKDLPYWIDPPQGIDHPAAQGKEGEEAVSRMREMYGASYRAPQAAVRDGIDIRVSKRRGVVKGFGSATIKVDVILQRPGRHECDIECFFPDLGSERSPHLTLDLVGHGPRIAVSDRILEYGIVPLGNEAEGRLTVSNPSPVPLVFNIFDTHSTDEKNSLCLNNNAREDERLVILPQSGTLNPKQSMEITVYFRGLEVGEASDKLQIRVADGGENEFVEFHASVQVPDLAVTPCNINVGWVDRHIARAGVAKLTNLCAIDIPYDIVPLDLPSDVHVHCNAASGTLLAGAVDAEVPFQITFKGHSPAVAVLAVRSAIVSDLVPFEITCAGVNEMQYSVGISTASESFARLPVEDYVSALVGNLANRAVDTSEKAATEESLPYCAPIIEMGAIDGLIPFSISDVKLSITNHSGCISQVDVTADRYAPPELPDAPALPPAAMAMANQTSTTLGATNSALNQSLQSKKALLLGSTKSTRHKDAQHLQTNKALALSSGTQGKTFTSKVLNGEEAMEKERAIVLERAQKLLADGRGFAVSVTDGSEGILDSFGSHEVFVRLIANLPGQYVDRLKIKCRDANSISIPVQFTVTGRPLILDPNTSGLSVNAHGCAELALPPLVAGMLKVKRSFLVTSRCPRDLLVSCAVVLHKERLGVSYEQGEEAEDGSGRLSVSLVSKTKQPVELSKAQMEGKNAATSPDGRCSVSPSAFIVPALLSQEIVFEYTPPVGASADWKASLLLTPTIAETPFNTKFLIDEFYLLNADRFPASRQIPSQSVIDKAGYNVRGVPKVGVRAPIVSRPGVIQNSAVIVQEDVIGGVSLRPPSQVSNNSSGTPGDNNIDDDDEEETIPVEDQEFEERQRQVRQTLLARAAERAEVVKFIEKRQSDLRAMCVQHFTPIEVDIKVKHVVPRLTCDPEHIVRFPKCKATGDCERVVQLANTGTTPIDFKISADHPFKIIRTLLRLEGEKRKELFPPPQSKLVGTSSGRPTSKESQAASALYRLNPLQTLFVTLQLTELATVPRGVTNGTMTIDFGNGFDQKIDLLATTHLPTLRADPPATVFRPPMLLTGGKKQPQYKRVIKLVNDSECEARFRITHERVMDSRKQKAGGRVDVLRGTASAIDGGRHTGKLLKTQAAEPSKTKSLANVISISRTTEEFSDVVDDPDRFVFDIITGVVPPATLGGAPSVLEINAEFREYASVLFESTFVVEVEGGVGCTFSVKGESRSTEVE